MGNLNGRIKRLEERMLGSGPPPKCERCHDVPVVEQAYDGARVRFRHRRPCPVCGSPRRGRINRQKPRED